MVRILNRASKEKGTRVGKAKRHKNGTRDPNYFKKGKLLRVGREN